MAGVTAPSRERHRLGSAAPGGAAGDPPPDAGGTGRLELCRTQVAVSILAEMVRGRYDAGTGLSLKGTDGRIHAQRPDEG